MTFNKLLSTVITIYSVFANNCSAQVDIEIRQNGDYFVKCNNNNNLFTTTTRLSNGLNNLISNYFKTNSVVLDNDRINTLIFKGVESIKPCTLFIKSNANFKPNIIFNCGDNQINFPKIIGNNIGFKIISNKPFLITNCSTINATDNQQNNYSSGIPLCGAFVIGTKYSSFEMAVHSDTLN